MSIKSIYTISAVLALTFGLSSCSTKPEVVSSKRTLQTEALLSNLQQMPNKGIMFGHHDDPLYGIGWEGDADRSDVKSVVGEYPAVMSFDIGQIELGSNVSLDDIPFDKIRQEIIAQYERGGLNTISWHAFNPSTEGNSWDVSDTAVVASILPGGINHDKFMGWLDSVSAFMNSLETADGTKVPILFRPWHEHTGNWFWWGQNYATDQQYKDLWMMTYDRLNENGVNNLLYAYSPGTEPKDTTQYLARYPGDDVIDLIGFDAYQFNEDQYLESMSRSLSIIDSIGKAHNKIIAITETGYETIPDSIWWTDTLYPAIENYPLAYVLVWRNARERDNHYYAPYPGQVSAPNFVEFYNKPEVLFVENVAGTLYQ